MTKDRSAPLSFFDPLLGRIVEMARCTFVFPGDQNLYPATFNQVRHELNIGLQLLNFYLQTFPSSAGFQAAANPGNSGMAKPMKSPWRVKLPLAPVKRP